MCEVDEVVPRDSKEGGGPVMESKMSPEYEASGWLLRVGVGETQNLGMIAYGVQYVQMTDQFNRDGVTKLGKCAVASRVHVAVFGEEELVGWERGEGGNGRGGGKAKGINDSEVMTLLETEESQSQEEQSV